MLLMLVPVLAGASTLDINISGSGVSIQGISLPSLPLPISLGQPNTGQSASGQVSSDDQQAATSEAAASGASGYGGYANGYQGAANLPEDLGSADAGLSTGEINSAGGIVPDWPGTPQNESAAKAAGVVELAGVRLLQMPLSLGSAGSSASPDTGLVGRVSDLTVPGVGGVSLGYFQTRSNSLGTASEMKMLLVRFDSLGIDMQIPLGQSSALVTRSNGSVTSTGTSTLLGRGPGQPLEIGQGLLSDDSVLGLQLLDAGSASSADGSKASTSSYWTLANASALGDPVLMFNSRDGLQLGGTILIPAPDTGKPLIAINQIAGLTSITIGETWSQTDGKSYAFGGADAVRVSLLGDDSFLVLGHAGSGANAVSATGPGAGPDQGSEGPPGVNIPPAAVSPPNDVPTAPGLTDNPIGPGPEPPKPEPEPVPQPVGPGAPPAVAPPDYGAPGEGLPFYLDRVLPNTGGQLVVYLMAGLAIVILASYAVVPMGRSIKGIKEGNRRSG